MSDSGYLSERVAIVTGGSRGIGAATARRLASDGAHVVLTYKHSADKAKVVANACNARAGSASTVQADAANVEGGRALVEQVIKDHGRLDVLVNNAAILAGADLLNVCEEDFDRTIDTNLKGLFFLTQSAASHMAKGGRIVNIGSIFGETVPYPGLDLYSMTKFGVAGLTRAWARDLAEKGITVNCIQPGPINTDMNPQDGDFAQAMLPRAPLGRYGRPEEIAEMVAYLVGPNTDNVSGAILNNDGGWNA